MLRFYWRSDHPLATLEGKRSKKLPALEEVDYNLERWLDKWQFIIRNDRELSKASAGLALEQLNEIVQYEFEQARKNYTDRGN
jgi:hypothetical protein